MSHHHSHYNCWTGSNCHQYTMDAETLKLIQEFKSDGLPSYPEDRIVETYHPETLDFFKGSGKSFHALDDETFVRWGYCTKERVEYVFVRHINSNKTASKLRVAVYEAQELGKKLADFLYHMRDSGLMKMGPTDPLPKLTKLAGRDPFESTDDVRRSACNNPDFFTESKNVKVRVFARGRAYYFCLLNPAPDSKIGTAGNYSKEWYGSSVIFSTAAVAEFLQLLMTIPEEIKKFRHTE